MKKIELDITPLAISTILLMISIAITLFSNYILSLEHYIGMFCLSISIFLYFTKRKIYYVFFGLSLLAGLIGYLDFYYVNYKFGFGIISFNPIFLLLIILLFIFAYYIADKRDSTRNNR